MPSLIVVVNTFIIFLNLTKQGVTATPLQLLGDPLPLNPQPSDPLATNPFIPLSMCDNFQIQNSAFNAICPFGTVDPVDLNQCITNVDGNMVNSHLANRLTDNPACYVRCHNTLQLHRQPPPLSPPCQRSGDPSTRSETPWTFNTGPSHIAAKSK
ncbi:hypothetical protein BKA66DRAFT_577040 [Pyrenochaeta sp. MPI-SDFR-AT-0127]|nr:hypothetical protein BKA66DRAFT_577040 [Pyrenochaeta sp. MPI-SDFR-AT-0127]